MSDQYLFDVSCVFFAFVLDAAPPPDPSLKNLRLFSVTFLAEELPEGVSLNVSPWTSPTGETHVLATARSKVRPLIHYDGTKTQERALVEVYANCHLYGISKRTLLQHIPARILMNTYQTHMPRRGIQTVANLRGVSYKTKDILDRYEALKKEIRDEFEEEDDEE